MLRTDSTINTREVTTAGKKTQLQLPSATHLVPIQTSHTLVGSHALSYTGESNSEHDSYARDDDTRDMMNTYYQLYYDRHTTSFFHQQMKIETLQTST